ncbi:MAG: dihydroorotate dehydrogenase electron transfer subunit, partial [Gammaproteobacteria bacterium]|nr:dihydroorotate dehydrogenase electron transfer subunit [Gammaproteobacteria bacterium]
MTTAAQKLAQQNRGTIFVEDGEILRIEKFDGEQFVQRIRAPKCAAAAKAGSFVHISCDETLPMRRPLSIMRAQDDWIEVLYKTHGWGLHLLAEKGPGDVVSVLGPIGQPFRLDPERPRVLMIGGGVGIPPMVFLADTLRHDSHYSAHAILGSEIPFPFPLVPSELPFPGADDALTSTMPLLESWRIPTRLTSLADFDGCYLGYVTDLADQFLTQASDDERNATRIYACGPTPMLQAVATLAAKHKVACDVSLEEFMA